MYSPRKGNFKGGKGSYAYKNMDINTSMEFRNRNDIGAI